MRTWWCSQSARTKHLLHLACGGSLRARIPSGNVVTSAPSVPVCSLQAESVRALRAVHARFYLATLPLAIGLVGPGLIGKTLLDQLRQQLQVGIVSRHAPPACLRPPRSRARR
jgi:hypothetical protein